MTTEDEWITIAQAAVIAECSYQTARNRALRAHGKRKKEGARWYVRQSWAESLVVGRGGTTAVAQIEGLKTRLAAVEKERDALVHAQLSKQGEIKALQKNWGVRGKEIEGLRVRVKAVEKKRDQAIVSRDKWRAESTRQKNQIEGLKARIERQRKEIEALKLELQTYADTYAESKPPAIIDRLVAAVDSAPLETLTQIDKPRHAALRRVVSLWSAVDHALVMFTQPGDIAQTTNDDDEVT